MSGRCASGAKPDAAPLELLVSHAPIVAAGRHRAHLVVQLRPGTRAAGSRSGRTRRPPPGCRHATPRRHPALRSRRSSPSGLGQCVAEPLCRHPLHLLRACRGTPAYDRMKSTTPPQVAVPQTTTAPVRGHGCPLSLGPHPLRACPKPAPERLADDTSGRPSGARSRPPICPRPCPQARTDDVPRPCRTGRTPPGRGPGASGESVVPHTGFEPVISALRGRCPGPLDECGAGRWGG